MAKYMGYSDSPLRYPGGKSCIFNFLAELVKMNNLMGGVYIEPFAGGAGAALRLLFKGYVEKIILNDADRNLFLFWKGILEQTEEFLRRVVDTPVNIEEWRKQRYIFKNPSTYSEIEIGFSTFYLNRCNRSGILYAGPIGGQDQSGKWKLDARFNKKNLIKRIEAIAFNHGKISIYNKDAICFLREDILSKSGHFQKALIYLDPPYYKKGSSLYLSFYQPEDHEKLATFVKTEIPYKWIVSYDNVSEIQDLYRGESQIMFDLNYSVYSTKVGNEILFYSKGIAAPTNVLKGQKDKEQMVLV